MIRQVDKYHTKQHGLEKEQAPGNVPTLLLFPPLPGLPDNYHSAREPSEFEYDSEEIYEPEEGGDENEEEDGDDASVCSDMTNQSNDHNTDQTR